MGLSLLRQVDHPALPSYRRLDNTLIIFFASNKLSYVNKYHESIKLIVETVKYRGLAPFFCMTFLFFFLQLSDVNKSHESIEIIGETVKY